MTQKTLSARHRASAAPLSRRRGRLMIAGRVVASAGLVLAVAAPSSTEVLPASEDADPHHSAGTPSDSTLRSVSAPPGSVVAFDLEAVGVVARDVPLSLPVSGARVSSTFGPRVDPVTGSGQELHTGMDFATACGTPVRAAAGGTVTETGMHAHGGGLRTVVDHGGGMRTTYNHLNSIEVGPGTAVRREAVLGTVGSTGNSTGCHLHFEVVVDEVTVDPQPWL